MKKKTLKKIPKLHVKIEAIQEQIGQRKYLLVEGASTVTINAELAELESQMQAILDKKRAVQRYQKTLDMGSVEPFNDAEEARVSLGYIKRLWNSLHVWQENIEKWVGCPFEEIDIETILEQSTQHSKTVLICERNLPDDSTAVHRLKKLVFDFKETMPIVEALGNKYLNPVHWEEIKAILGTPSFPLEAKQFSLGELVGLNVAKYADEIVNVSVTATQEFNLQAQLDQLT